MANYPTPHIEIKDPSVIAKTVLMPGDPLRAKFIAETFLTDVKQINGVRNMFGYTGLYNGKPITVFGSGMGQPSIGIYSYELFNFYGVENIIRIGSAGSYSADLAVYDTVLVTNAYSESTFAKVAFDMDADILPANEQLNDALRASAKEVQVPLKEATIHSSDVFYHKSSFSWEALRDEFGCKAVEMESYALFANAIASGKRAACLLTISDSFVTHEETTAEERQNSFTDMMKVALNLVEHV
jgi:purine-nucleoside phosphorylase